MAKEARFSLLLDPEKDAPELMAECGWCGASTTQLLDAAWHAGFVTCRQCGVQGTLTSATMRQLRDLASWARDDIDRLLRPG